MTLGIPAKIQAQPPMTEYTTHIKTHACRHVGKMPELARWACPYLKAVCDLCMHCPGSDTLQIYISAWLPDCGQQQLPTLCWAEVGNALRGREVRYLRMSQFAVNIPVKLEPKSLEYSLPRQRHSNFQAIRVLPRVSMHSNAYGLSRRVIPLCRESLPGQHIRRGRCRAPPARL